MVIINSLRNKYIDTKEDREDLFLTSLYLGLINNVILSLANFSKQGDKSINFSFMVNCIKNMHPVMPDDEYGHLLTELDEFEHQVQTMTSTLNSIIVMRDTTIAHIDKRHINNPRSLEITNSPYWDEITDVIRIIADGLDKVGVYFGLNPSLPYAEITNPLLVAETYLVFDTIYYSKHQIKSK